MSFKVFVSALMLEAEWLESMTVPGEILEAFLLLASPTELHLPEQHLSTAKMRGRILKESDSSFLFRRKQFLSVVLYEVQLQDGKSDPQQFFFFS